ncbi:S-adenosylmethionine decarboxylase [Stackebrandtia soli]|uniref:S-adenosylmethionine decarboxylase n=1 Tax=Stackebrandtia soli TaxID=1892856 RepID=UPI0039EB90DA
MIEELRTLLAHLTARDELGRIGADVALFGEDVGLDSLTGMRLLQEVKDRYGVDVAAEDLNLDALASLGALAAFITIHRPDPMAGLSIMREIEAYTPKTLYLVDATYTDAPLLSDIDGLTRAARAAVDSAGGHVLSDNHVVFPNGAITLIMILAESHLSVHTWPEESRVAIDLFSCGMIDGRAVITELSAALAIPDPDIRAIDRG